MKKFLNSGILVLLVVLQSCEEKGVLIDFGSKKDIFDTTYIAAIETPQGRNVLIEEFTGASCTNCPAGHATVASLVSANPDRVIALAYHTFFGGSIFKPVNKDGVKSLYDFRDSAATNIGTTIFGGVSSIPVAGVDRIKVGSSLLLGRTDWASETNKRLSAASPVNLYLSSSFDNSANKVTLKVKVAYTASVSTKNTLTLGVVESNITDAQEYPDRIDTFYVHNHIFRQCLTPYYGNTILDSITVKQPGRVYEYNYSFTPAASWKLENCQIVAILSNNESDNKEVLQAKEVKLK